jgi:hypothetical protein
LNGLGRGIEHMCATISARLERGEGLLDPAGVGAEIVEPSHLVVKSDQRRGAMITGDERLNLAPDASDLCERSRGDPG